MSCKQCGECCRQMIFMTYTLPPEYVEYYEKKGCKLRGSSLVVPYVCPHLSEDNLCKIYEDRPALCKEYEGQAGFYKPKGCGYGSQEKTSGSS